MSAAIRRDRELCAAGSSRPGVTLVELLVVLAILGLLAGVVGLTWRDDAWVVASDQDASAARAAVTSARREAVATGRSVRVVVDSGPNERIVTALPDGRVIGAEPLGFDPLSGRGDREPGAADPGTAGEP